MGLQECQRKHTSTEFLERLFYLEKEEWTEPSKQDYYLAQIAALVRQVLEMFSKNPKTFNTKDFILPFTKESQPTKETPEPSKTLFDDLDEESEDDSGGIEVNPDVVLDEKWARVNAEAQASWGAFLGAKLGEDNGGTSPTT